MSLLIPPNIDELFVNLDGQIRRHPQFSKHLPTNEGAVILLPDSLASELDALPDGHLAARLQAIGEEFDSLDSDRRLSYQKIRFSKVLRMLCTPHERVKFYSGLQFTTRDKVLTALLTDDVDQTSAQRDLKSRRRDWNTIIQDCLAMGIVETLQKPYGRIGGVYKVTDDLTAVNFSAFTARKSGELDIAESLGLSVDSRQLPSQSYAVISRQDVFNARPHDNCPEGTPITEYQVESFIREAGRNIPTKLVATTPRGHEVPVTDATGAMLWERVLFLIERDVTELYEQTGQFKTQYNIRAAQIAEIMGKNPRISAHLDQARDVLTSWYYTTVEAELASTGLKDLDPNEADEILSRRQLKEVRELIPIDADVVYTKKGQRVIDAALFELPPAQAEAMRYKVLHKKEAKALGLEVPERILRKNDDAIVQDSLAAYLNNFFWTVVHPTGRGLSKTFKESEVINPPSKVNPGILNRLFNFRYDSGALTEKGRADAKRQAWRRALFSFFERFADDPAQAKATWLGLDGGTLKIDVPGVCLLIFKLDKRGSQNRPISGTVEIPFSAKALENAQRLTPEHQVIFDLFDNPKIKTEINRSLRIEAARYLKKETVVDVINHVVTRTDPDYHGPQMHKELTPLIQAAKSKEAARQDAPSTAKPESDTAPISEAELADKLARYQDLHTKANQPESDRNTKADLEDRKVELNRLAEELLPKLQAADHPECSNIKYRKPLTRDYL